MGFSQKSVDGSALSAGVAGASARSGWLAPFAWLLFTLCLVSFGRVVPVAAEVSRGESSFSSHSATLESPVRTAPQAKLVNRGPRLRVLVQQFEAPAALARTVPVQTGTISRVFQPMAMEPAVSAGSVGLTARAPPVNGIL